MPFNNFVLLLFFLLITTTACVPIQLGKCMTAHPKKKIKLPSIICNFHLNMLLLLLFIWRVFVWVIFEWLDGRLESSLIWVHELWIHYDLLWEKSEFSLSIYDQFLVFKNFYTVFYSIWPYGRIEWMRTCSCFAKTFKNAISLESWWVFAKQVRIHLIRPCGQIE
jgi:hypothetical protein